LEVLKRDIIEYIGTRPLAVSGTRVIHLEGHQYRVLVKGGATVMWKPKTGPTGCGVRWYPFHMVDIVALKWYVRVSSGYVVRVTSVTFLGS
jgi:hypothetical protein